MTEMNLTGIFLISLKKRIKRSFLRYSLNERTFEKNGQYQAEIAEYYLEK